MSKVVRGVRKVFKKVTKVVKRVAPIVLAAAAIYFTAGAALGVAGTAGGWGAVSASIGGELGAGTLGSVVTGAITQAGYGAAIGGVLSKAGGGSFSQGAKGGAITGAVTGGLMGGMGMKTDPLEGIGTKGPAAAPGGVNPAGGPELAGPAGSTGAQPVNAAANSGLDAHALDVLAREGTSTATNATQPGGGLFGPNGWVERNQKLVGGAIQGVGQGLMGAAQAEGEMDLLRERHNLRASNYQGVNPGAGYTQANPGGSGQSPTQRFDPKTYGDWEYQYNPQTGRIERVPVGG